MRSRHLIIICCKWGKDRLIRNSDFWGIQGADKLWRHLLKRRFFTKCAEFTCYFYFFVITMHFVIISIYYLPLVGFLFRMVAPSSKRSIIIILYQAGNQTKDIVKLMKISRTMVQKTVKRFKEIGSAADRPGRGRKRSARTEQNKTSFVR